MGCVVGGVGQISGGPCHVMLGLAGAGRHQTEAGVGAKTRTRNKADMTVRLGQPGFKSLTLLRIRSPAWRGEKRRFHKI